MNMKIIFIGGGLVLAAIIGVSLLCRFGFGLSIGGNSKTVEESPDQSDDTVSSHNEHLDNS